MCKESLLKVLEDLRSDLHNSFTSGYANIITQLITLENEEWGCCDFTEPFVTDECIFSSIYNDLTEHKENALLSTKIRLNGINYFSAMYYYREGDDNFRNVTSADIENAIDDIITKAKG